MRRTKHIRRLPVFLIAAAALVLASAVRAQDEGEVPFDDLKFFFEFNSTDNDLGVQLLLDGDAWDRLTIRDPRGRKILDIKAGGRLAQLGLTELFWESDEPSPEEVLALFPEGEYEFEGRTIEGDELEGEVTLSHDFPAAPVIVSPSPGATVDADEDLTVDWTAGSGGDVPDASYQFILEREDLGIEILIVNLHDASTTSVRIPEEFLDEDTEYKYEVLAIAENENRKITEAEFQTE